MFSSIGIMQNKLLNKYFLKLLQNNKISIYE